MLKTSKNLVIVLLLTSKYFFGQYSLEYQDSLRNSLVANLKQQKVDTFCFYKYVYPYFGVNKYYEYDKDNECGIISEYVIWKKNGKSFLTKENCFDYSPVEVEMKDFWKLYSVKRQEILNEKINGYSHYHHGRMFIQIIVGIDTISKYLKEDFFKRKSVGKLNYRYRHNINSKTYKLLTILDKVVTEVEQKEQLRNIEEDSIVVVKKKYLFINKLLSADSMNKIVDSKEDGSLANYKSFCLGDEKWEPNSQSEIKLLVCEYLKQIVTHKGYKQNIEDIVYWKSYDSMLKPSDINETGLFFVIHYSGSYSRIKKYGFIYSDVVALKEVSKGTKISIYKIDDNKSSFKHLSGKFQYIMVVND